MAPWQLRKHSPVRAPVERYSRRPVVSSGKTIVVSKLMRWAMFAGFDRRYLQLKPGLLLSVDETQEALAALDRACQKAAGL